MNDRKGQVIAYLRVSTYEQNLDRQEDLAEEADKVFREHASAATTERPEFQKMMEWVREGDLIRVWCIDRLARNMIDLLTIVDELNAKGVSIEFVSERMHFSGSEKDADPFKRLQLHQLASYAEFERAMNRARQREGIVKAQALGKYKGRKSVLTEEVVATAKERFAQGVSISRIAKDAGISRASIYKALKMD